MANMLGHADKRTEQQRHDDAITGRDDLTPTALNNEGNMVGTGPNTKRKIQGRWELHRLLKILIKRKAQESISPVIRDQE